MATCDVCNAVTSWEEGTAYTADEFRQIVSQGFKPPEMIIMFSMAMTGVSEEQAIAQWRQGLVAQSTTNWLLCPSCAAQAARYLPKPAGARPADHKLVEPLTPEMLAPVQEPGEEVAGPRLAPAGPPPEAAAGTTKKCPLCAEGIKLEARVCRYCGARFEVVMKGYCTQCHAVVEAGEDGRCQQCGNEVLDKRIESSFWEEPALRPDQPGPTRVLQTWERKGEGVWNRFSAVLFDWFVVMGLSIVPIGLLVLLALLTVGAEVGEAEQGTLASLTASGLFVIPIVLSVPIIWFLYFTILEGTFGTTLGKLIGAYPATLKVVKKDGSRCGYLRAGVRAFLGLFETGLLGALVIWLTIQRQRIGDLIAGTLVVDTRKVLTVTFLPTPSVVFDFIDGRRVEFSEILRGDIQKWLDINTMTLVGVTPQGRRMALNLTFPNARKREELRGELERFFQIRITEHLQWWRLVLALVAVAIIVSCCLFVIVLAPTPPSGVGPPALFETAVPVWETAVAPLIQGTAVVPPTSPKRTPTVAATPAAGTAMVQGRILWNDEPFADVTVKLCSDWSLVGGCKGVEYQARSGGDGGYRIAGVAPGEYSFVTKLPGQVNETKWIGVSVEVQADQVLTVRDVNVVKYDLKLTSPADEATVRSSTPTLTWEPYPGAASYKVYVSGGEPSKAVVNFEEVTAAQYDIKTPLGAGEYYWRVYAYNAGGTRIAEQQKAGHFTVVGP